jgi:predicted CoA-binding protein
MEYCENKENLIQEFLSQKTFAVVGSFRHETKYAYRIVKYLKSKGYAVYPVNPTAREVDGLKCYPAIADLPVIVDVADIVTPPSVTMEIVQQCLLKGITRIWLQPGAESESVIKFCQENNLKVIYQACIMLGK